MKPKIAHDIQAQIEHLERHHGQHAKQLTDALAGRKATAKAKERELIDQALARHKESLSRVTLNHPGTAL